MMNALIVVIGSRNVRRTAATSLLAAVVFTSAAASQAAAAPFAYVTSLGFGTVAVIDVETNVVVATIVLPAGSNPLDIAAAPDGRSVYVTSASFPGTVTVIDVASNTVLGPDITVGNAPRGIVVGADGAFAYVANQFSDTVSVIDTTSHTVVATIPVGSQPTGISITPDGSRLYVANSVDGTTSVIDTATNVVLGSAIPVGWNPQALTVSPNGVHVYVSNFNSHDISVIETVSGTVSATIPVGFFPFGMAMTPDGTRLYVADSDPQANNGSVAVIDTAINSVITRVTLPMFHTSRRIAVTPDGTRGYIAINTPQEVLVFDTSSNLLVGGPIPIDGIPEGIAITPSAQDSVLFSALTATVKVRRNHPYGFVANGTFALGEGHNGISPAIEDTQVSIVDATGTVLFVETLPNGSFKGTSHGGVVLYTSNPTGSIAAMLIKSNHKRNVHRVQLRVRSSAIVPWSPLPLTLSLQIGNDSGSVELRCEQDASFWVCH